MANRDVFALPSRTPVEGHLASGFSEGASVLLQAPRRHETSGLPGFVSRHRADLSSACSAPIEQLTADLVVPVLRVRLGDDALEVMTAHRLK
jgi:hypothetical protein